MGLVITQDNLFIKIVPEEPTEGSAVDERIRITDISDVNQFDNPPCVALIKNNGLSHSFEVGNVKSIDSDEDMDTPTKVMNALMAIINP